MAESNNIPTQEQPHQSETEKVNAEGEKMDIDIRDLSIEEDLPHRRNLRTFNRLREQADAADAAYQEAVDAGAEADTRRRLKAELKEAEEDADDYREHCKKRFPSCMEFYTKEEIADRNAAIIKDEDKNRSHFVPKDLPALQIIVAERWLSSKAAHVSTERFLKKFKSEVEACNFKVEEHWVRLFPKCLNDIQLIWFEGVLEDKPDITWDEFEKKAIDKYDTPEQQLVTMECVLHMRQRHGEKMAVYARKFHQRCVESGLDKFPKVMNVAFLSSLANKQDVYALASTKFGNDLLKVSLAEMVSYVASLQLDTSDNKRPREEESGSQANRRPRLFARSGTSASIHNPQNQQRSQQRGFDPSTCIYCKGPRQPGHRCEEYHRQKGFSGTNASRNGNGERVSRTAHRVVDVSTDDALPCKSKEKEEKEQSIDQDDETLVFITVERRNILSLLDGGATFSAIDYKFCNKEKIRVIPVNGHILLASSEVKCQRIGVTEPLEICHNKRRVKHVFEVMNITRGHPMSIGKNLFKDLGIGYTGLAPTWSDYIKEEKKVKEIDDTVVPNHSPAGSDVQQATFHRLIKSSLEKNKQVPLSSLCPLPEALVSIPTPEGVVCYRKQYEIPHKAKEAVEAQIQQWLKNRTIVELPPDADNRWNNPLTVAKKHDEHGNFTGYRICLDSRLLNHYQKLDSYPIPSMQEIFDKLAGSQCYTKLDLYQAFTRFKVKKSDRHKLSLTGPNGKRYMHRGCSFGLRPLSAMFQKCMAKILDLPYVTIFVDDILVFSKDLKDHAYHVSTVIDRLTAANFILQPKKCFFMQKSVYLLGFKIDQYGHSPDRQRVINAQNWPVP